MCAHACINAAAALHCTAPRPYFFIGPPCSCRHSCRHPRALTTTAMRPGDPHSALPHSNTHAPCMPLSSCCLMSYVSCDQPEPYFLCPCALLQLLARGAHVHYNRHEALRTAVAAGDAGIVDALCRQVGQWARCRTQPHSHTVSHAFIPRHPRTQHTPNTHPTLQQQASSEVGTLPHPVRPTHSQLRPSPPVLHTL